MTDPQFGGEGDREQRTEVTGYCGRRQGWACWWWVTAATNGLGGRAWNVQDSPCNAPLTRALVWSLKSLSCPG